MLALSQYVQRANIDCAYLSILFLFECLQLVLQSGYVS